VRYRRGHEGSGLADRPPGCLGHFTKVNRCLAEGRKRFLERYAGIESGRECERLAPLLSAFVDGEADGARALELRRHLRGCLSCRAAVRGLHDASQPLTIVFPAAAMVAANGGAEHTGSFFVRVYETVTMSMHERAANSFLRAQAIVDTVTAGKMAAAAASAAALAGGGVAVEGVLSASPATPAAIVRRADNAVATALVKQSTRRARTSTHAKGRSHARASSARHRQGPAKPASGPSRRAATVLRSSSSPPPASTPRPTAASSGGGGAGGTSASSEFGFEGP
jgi:hypothetical protein